MFLKAKQTFDANANTIPMIDDGASDHGSDPRAVARIVVIMITIFILKLKLNFS